MKAKFVKCLMYGIVAALTAISTDLSHVKDISTLQSGEILQICIKILIQIAIAIRAYLDPTSFTPTAVNVESENITTEEAEERVP